MASSQGLEMGGALLVGWGHTPSVPSLNTPSAWERLLLQLGALSGEYLFVLGASLIALLLLSRRRWFLAACAFALALLWLSFHLPVSLYLESLGADSFAETQGFDLDEARFWAQTLREAIQPDFSLKKFVAYLAAAVLLWAALRALLQRMGLAGRRALAGHLAVALACMGLAVHQTTAQALAFYLENTAKFHATASHFDRAPPPAQQQGPALDLVVYIGESTSTMNMGLYGYTRATTPALRARAARDAQLLVFDAVLATHAHTSRSLLEALSFGVDASQAFVPITERDRISVVDVLRQAGLEPRLLSNQGQGGSWDQASSVIFRNSVNTFRARVRSGQADASPPWDHAFFEAQLQALPPPGPAAQALFLHSYAGHGPYLQNIPPAFREPVDAQLQTLAPGQVVREPGVSVAQIEAYDAAIRYVDHSVDRLMARLQTAPRPTVLVYFSDHGDAVFAGFGHDSARFRHEMARVPFLIYFNDAAARARPELLAKYRRLAQARRVATLAQLPSTLLDLAGVRILDAQAVLQTPVVGEPVELPPILVRQTVEGISYVHLGGRPAPATSAAGQPLIDRTDEDTRRFLASRSPLQQVHHRCPAEPQTLEEISRATLVLGCPPVAVQAGAPRR